MKVQTRQTASGWGAQVLAKPGISTGHRIQQPALERILGGFFVYVPGALNISQPRWYFAGSACPGRPYSPPVNVEPVDLNEEEHPWGGPFGTIAQFFKFKGYKEGEEWAYVAGTFTSDQLRYIADFMDSGKVAEWRVDEDFDNDDPEASKMNWKP